ncbi:TPA: fimbrial protein [Salmonella enterica subsp. enterica serovar Aberdeen]
MKHAEKAGSNNTGKVSAARRRYPCRLSVISGLALLLSAGISGKASALTFTFEYTYTITANTCSLSATGTRNDGPVSGQASLYVDWGTVTKAQLTEAGQTSKKTFGLVMTCDGDIWKPTLTVTSQNRNTTAQAGTLYVTDSADSVAGFAVRAADSSDATETGVTQKALSNQGTEQTLSETEHSKKMLLTAWPTIMPGKKSDDLKSGTDIAGTVTINVSYN